MATIADLNVRIGASFADLEKGLRGAEKALQRSGQRLSNLGGELSLAITAPLGALGIASIKAAGDIEALGLALETQLGSAAAAAEELEKLRKIALQPGLAFEQAVRGSVSLQAVGQSAEDARNIIAQFGNGLALAGRSGQDLDGVILALTQISAKGIVSAEEINQIAERLPQIRTLLKDAFGTANTETLQKLGVTSEQFISQITKELEKLPRATGGIKNAIENSGDAVKQFLATIGTEINKAFDLVGLSERLSKTLSGVAAAFSGLDDSTKRFIVQAGLLLVTLGPAVKLLGVFQLTAASSITVLTSLASSLKPVALLFAGLTSSTQSLPAFFGGLARAVGGAELAVTRFRLAFIAATGGAVVILAAIAGAAFLLSERFDGASFAAEKFAQAQTEVRTETAKETAELNANFAVLLNTNSGYDQRKKAIDELQKAYPDYLRGIDLEKASNTELEKIQKRVNQAILQGVAERKKASAVNAIYEKQADLLLRIAEIQRGAAVTAGESRLVVATDIDVFNVKGSIAAKVVQRLGEQVDALGKQAETSAKDFDKAFNLQGRAVDLAAAKEADLRQAYLDREEAAREALTTGGKIAETDFKAAGAAQAAATALGDQEKALRKSTKAQEEKNRVVREALELKEKDITPLAPSGNITSTVTAAFQADPTALPELSIGGLVDSLSTLNEIAAAIPITVTAAIAPAQALFEGLTNNVLTMGEAWQALGQIVTENGSGIEQVAFAMGDAIATFAEQGGGSLAEFANVAVQAGKKVIAILIKEGVAGAISNALKNSAFALANPLAAVALAGAAGIAASALFSGILGKVKIPALAEGGITTGPQLAMVGDNPGGREAIIPLNKLPGLLGGMGGNGYIAETRIQGTELILLLKRADVAYQRTVGKR